MKKIVRLTESDLTRLVKRIVLETNEENKPKKTDATTNPYWKQLVPKLKALGFTEKVERFNRKHGLINIGGYPDIDFTQSLMIHKPTGVQVKYPYSTLDSTGDYYPDYIDMRYSGYDLKKLKNTSCVGTPDKNDNTLAIKIQCVDYIYGLILKSIQNQKK
jgi:hypothetical protein